MTGTNLYHPLVSVIIPNYNHAPYLKQRIDSVLDQTYSNLEVIILDDNSIDNSRMIIEAYQNNPKVVYIEYNEVNSGSTFYQWQKGLNLAKGEWIWIAESDDVAESNFLEKLLNLNGDKSEIRYCASYLINEENEIISDSIVPTPPPNTGLISGKEFIRQYLVRENSIPNASAVIFKKKLVRIDTLKSIVEFKLNGDWMFWINILINTNICFIETPLNKFRVHSQTVRSKEKSNALLEYFHIASLLDELGYSKEVSDRLRFIFYSRNLNKKEKSKIYLHFLRKFNFRQLFLLFLKR